MPQYQGVWSLQQQMQALTSGQWATDPLFDYTTLLLQADDAANSAQNNTFLDSSTNAFAITRNGNTTQGTFSPFSLQPGAWANFFDGSSAQLSIANSTNLDLGSGNWTIEAWLFPTAFSGNARFFSKQVLSGNGYAFRLQPTSGYIYAEIDAVNFLTTTVGPALNTWSHVAIVRNSNTVTIYLNGVSVGSASYSGTPSSQNSPTTISGYDISGSRSEYFPGYISNLRFVKGTAVYTSNFTPSTTPLTAVTNTQLLTCQSNRFVDNSTNAFTITANGTPSVQAFSPFAPQFQYTASGTGGSGYFDGSSDYLSASYNSAFAFTGDFTIECWVYWSAHGSSAGLLVNMQSSGATPAGWQVCFGGTGDNINFEITGSYPLIQSSSTLPKNAWTHVAIVRSGSATNNIKMYFNGVVVAQGTNTSTIDSTNASFYAGTERSITGFLTGYISGARIVKGTAVYTAAFTPPTAPPTAITNTSLLLNFTNAGILDGTMKNNLETVGNAQISTSVVKYGSGSMYFDGSGDYLRPNSGNIFNFGTGDFTVEFWLYLNSTAAQTFIDCRPGSAGDYILFDYDPTSKLRLYVGSTTVLSGSTLVTGQWYHIALARSGSTVRYFINGTQGASATMTTNLLSAANPYIGSNYVPDAYVNGYIDDLRVTKGIARYTQNFIPPSVALPRQ